MEFQRSRVEHPDFQEPAGHSYLLAFRTSVSGADSKQRSLPELTLRGPPLRGVDSLYLSCVVAAKISARTKCRRPQLCTDRIAAFPAISSTVRRNTASRVRY